MVRAVFVSPVDGTQYRSQVVPPAALLDAQVCSPYGYSTSIELSGNSRGVRLLEGRKLFWPEELPDVLAEEALALWS